ncbi:tetratricopeptide repeat protein [Pedobacter frigiditerrae]|uniref:Tetratricopeptide repeat protein n=1 Tax=Pedobacter frigiditerrae TaxID=2530452 RepID=A0A4R0N200_9SPHI|nr:tetratricopeptide repeat protein [Pedobacter frigiditerrae]TCC93303.1 tetratricopeptide repeat protein [Pedobacter frigiditerrae]
MKKLFLIIFFGFSFILLRAQDNMDEALAYQYYQQGEFEKAAVLLEKLFNKTKNDSYFDLYFSSLIKVKKYTEAESILKKLIKQYPQKSQYAIALGRVYQENGRTADANKIFQEAINNTPKDENKFREMANAFYRFEAYDMAISAFLQGRKIFGDEQMFQFELLSIYRFKKDKQMLIQEYINVLASTPQLLPQAQGVLASVFEDNADYQLLQNALLKKIQKDPQTEIYTELLTWQYIQQQQYEMALRQLIAQDKRTKGDGNLLFNTAYTFVSNKAYATAIKAYEYILTKGEENELYLAAKVALINAKYELAISGKYEKVAIQALADEYLEVLAKYGRNGQGLVALRKLANLQAYYLNDLKKAELTLESALQTSGISQSDVAQIKMDLGDIYVLTKQPWEAILAYEQVSKQFENQPLGNEAKFRSARIFFYVGDFNYAKSQADVLKASTSQLIANDALNLSLLINDNLQSKNDSLALKMYADAEMLQFMNKPDQSLIKLDSINIAYPNNSLADDILMAKAKIFIKTSDVPKAETMLKEIIANHHDSIWTDDALFILADLYEKKLNNPEEAKKLFQQLMNDYPGSMFNAEARKRFRNIRGDNVGT